MHYWSWVLKAGCYMLLNSSTWLCILRFKIANNKTISVTEKIILQQFSSSSPRRPIPCHNLQILTHVELWHFSLIKSQGFIYFCIIQSILSIFRSQLFQPRGLNHVMTSAFEISGNLKYIAWTMSLRVWINTGCKLIFWQPDRQQWKALYISEVQNLCFIYIGLKYKMN